ncbi:rhodanese-like domain-containing protein [Paenibacillus lutrae]|uniref:Rhodanese-like domain-containing protein n=1 Tax=Paenibacillus lutrae TaxID=2078573 RepID=A0A7X3FFK5_9BACL|nr:rhodanese-like domain-containing protein [Paenibacillus lutrae]MVO98766.1 rhodanese-like domain-containing protein [Paenibacillus lutrae]
MPVVLWGFILTLAAAAVWLIRSFWPLSGLNIVRSAASGTHAAQEIPSDPSLKILDVRDSLDYDQCHLPGSINISIGRLPFVWDKELSPEEPVLILADSRRKILKAARVLKNRGFAEVYALRGNDHPRHSDIGGISL